MSARSSTVEPGPGALEDGDDRRRRAAVVHLQREVGELGDDGVARPGQVQPQLGMAVQRPPQRHGARLQPPRLLAQPGEQGVGRAHEPILASRPMR